MYVPIFASLFGLFSLESCTHTADSKLPIKEMVVQDKTILPKNFVSNSSSLIKIIAPAKLLNVSFVSRAYAKWREGPGVEFKINDEMLGKGEMVLPIQNVGVWVKVLRIKNEKIGWVHHQTLGKIKPNKEQLKIDLNALPRVFAVRQIKRAFSYPSGTLLRVFIEKGRSFSYLKARKRKVLVYIESTNSVMWLSREDAQ